ncbi:MAG: LutB/LldF family L-lactate oxidation iron-sulfur protein [Alphaproteobacteria bacterium]
MQSTAHNFKANTRAALADASLQKALGLMRVGFIERRANAVARLPEFDGLRDKATEIKNHVLENLDLYLEIFEQNVRKSGGAVHWCRDAEEARKAILFICRLVGAETVTKGKSMIGEEIAINEYLEQNGITPVETDLGEYIIQLRREPPSHIIAPAIHVNKEQIADAFREHHTTLDPNRPLTDRADLLAEARGQLREKFLAADVGITGANFLIAETGSSIIVTNEGNGDLTQTLPRIHIVLASIEKIVPTLEDAGTILRVLARSATGQEMSVYTTISTGARREADLDGPEQYHVIMLDNGRSNMLGTEFQDALRCIRCGACLNHCPVYGTVGGHAYGWVYPGPIGAVVTPALVGLEEAKELPNASSFCGRCEEVCPMRIPLPGLMRHWREREFERHLQPERARRALKWWARGARLPFFYRLGAWAAAWWLNRQGRAQGGRFNRLSSALEKIPVGKSLVKKWNVAAVLDGWTATRDFPAPQSSRTFQKLWRGRRRIPFFGKQAR